MDLGLYRAKISALKKTVRGMEKRYWRKVVANFVAKKPQGKAGLKAFAKDNGVNQTDLLNELWRRGIVGRPLNAHIWALQEQEWQEENARFNAELNRPETIARHIASQSPL